LTSYDDDIKIASDKPSRDIKRLQQNPDNSTSQKTDTYNEAKDWGRVVAAAFIADANENPLTDESDFDMVIQRRLLLSFTASAGFEKFATDDFLCGVAQKSFLDTVRKEAPQLLETSQDTGAFSFYYLAFRRGGDTVRRIGQTFAMLCSHDGDPVYQELGEALYCWFLSVVKKAI
jgi:hypothetical protein